MDLGAQLEHLARDIARAGISAGISKSLAAFSVEEQVAVRVARSAVERAVASTSLPTAAGKEQEDAHAVVSGEANDCVVANNSAPSAVKEASLDDLLASGALAAKPKKSASGSSESKLALNLGTVPQMAQGEIALSTGNFVATARAQNEVAITVRGAAKARAKLLFKLSPKVLGNSTVKTAWQPGGKQIAVASERVDFQAPHSPLAHASDFLVTDNGIPLSTSLP